MKVDLSGFAVSYSEFPTTTQESARVVVAVRDIEATDRITTSQWNKFLFYLKDYRRPRESGSYMFRMEQLFVRPDLTKPHQEEARLTLNVLPFRLNIDQVLIIDLADFLVVVVVVFSSVLFR